MKKRIVALIFAILTIVGLTGCAADGTASPAPDWKNAPNRQAG
jgi:hypothetical protein